MESFNLETYQIFGAVWQLHGDGDLVASFLFDRVADTRINDLKCQDYPSF